MLKISKNTVIFLTISYNLIVLISFFLFVYVKYILLPLEIKDYFSYEGYFLIWIFLLISITIPVIGFISTNSISQLNYSVSLKLGWTNCIIIGIDFIDFSISFHATIIFYIFPFYLLIIGCILSINSYLLLSIHRITDKQKLIIRKTILDLGTQYSRLEIKDVSERCYINQNIVQRDLEEMILNKEIFASYSKKNKTIEFDQNSNIDEIDDLMKIYENWESEFFRKKVD